MSALDVPEPDRVVARMSASATARHDSTITRKTHAIDRATAKWSNVRALLIYSSVKFDCNSTTLLVRNTFFHSSLTYALAASSSVARSRRTRAGSSCPSCRLQDADRPQKTPQQSRSACEIDQNSVLALLTLLVQLPSR